MKFLWKFIFTTLLFFNVCCHFCLSFLGYCQAWHSVIIAVKLELLLSLSSSSSFCCRRCQAWAFFVVAVESKLLSPSSSPSSLSFCCRQVQAFVTIVVASTIDSVLTCVKQWRGRERTMEQRLWKATTTNFSMSAATTASNFYILGGNNTDRKNPTSFFYLFF